MNYFNYVKLFGTCILEGVVVYYFFVDMKNEYVDLVA